MADPRYIPTPAPRPAPSLFDAQAEAAPFLPADEPARYLRLQVDDALAVVVADVGQLERRHLVTLFEWTPPELRPAVANYVREHRPDLSAEVGAALLELEAQPQG